MQQQHTNNNHGSCASVNIGRTNRQMVDVQHIGGCKLLQSITCADQDMKAKIQMEEQQNGNKKRREAEVLTRPACEQKVRHQVCIKSTAQDS